MKLYKTKDGDNVINKTLSLLGQVSIELKGDINIVHPTLHLAKVQGINLAEANYAEIDELGRKYFIRSVSRKGELYTLSLECDVLETFKNEILNSTCVYYRKAKEGDYGNVKYDRAVGVDVDIFESDVEIPMQHDLAILAVIGD